MNKVKQKIISEESKMMERILEVRFSDLEEEKELCKQLLDVSEGKHYFYGSAFAYVYLLDSCLALGEYGSCDFYLLRASTLCKEYQFDDLMMMLCHCAGLYYQKLNDDQTALYYFLEGKKMAEKLGDIPMTSKFLNNIGYAFAIRKDWETSRTYFRMAFDMVKEDLTGDNITSAVTYLSNLSEICEHLGDVAGARDALEQCESMSEDDIYSRLRRACSWSKYYAMIGDRAQCIRHADELIQSDLSSVEDQFFVCDMAEGVCSDMLDIGDQERSEILLDIIGGMSYDESLLLQYRIQLLKIRFWEQFSQCEKLEQAYKDYFEIEQKMAELEEEMLIQSMRSKIQMNESKHEHELIMQQNLALENASQLDDLTGLYNRRYFNKLVSKMSGLEETKALGFIMIDIDYFKQYNDFYGHFKGDDALRIVAQVLAANACEGIHVSRYGGDEFVCLCVNLTDTQVEEYVRRVIGDLKSRRVPHEKHLTSDILTISLGYSNENVDFGVNPDTLLELADRALYMAKDNGKNGYARMKCR